MKIGTLVLAAGIALPALPASAETISLAGDELRAAMALAADTLGLLLEPAGAAGLAAIPLLEGESVATVLTGANADVR